MSDIDITQDLTDGRDAALSDVAPANNQTGDNQLVLPPGTQPQHGQDALQVNSVENKEPVKELTLRDQLSAGFKDTTGAPTDQQNAQSAQPNLNVQAPQLTQDGEGKWRLPDRTFASQEQVNAYVTASMSQGAQQQPAQEADPQFFASMTAQEQQQFKSLPAELQQYVGRTMEGLNYHAQRLNEYDLIEQQIIGPRRQAFAQNGRTPATALNELFALSDFAGRDPSNFVMWFAGQHNLDLDALMDARDAQMQSTDPQVAGLRQDIASMRGQLDSFFGNQQAQVQNTNMQLVQDFSTARDDKGELKRPYITDVMNEWGAHVQALRTANPQMQPEEILQRAYDAACWSNLNVRNKMQQALAATNQQQNQEQVNKAVAAGSSITGAPASNNSNVNNANRTLREELENQFRQAAA